MRKAMIFQMIMMLMLLRTEPIHPPRHVRVQLEYLA